MFSLASVNRLNFHRLPFSLGGSLLNPSILPNLSLNYKMTMIIADIALPRMNNTRC